MIPLLLLSLAAHATDDGHQAEPGEDVISASTGMASRRGAEVVGLGLTWERGLLPGISAALGGTYLVSQGGLVRLEGRWAPWDPDTDEKGLAAEVIAGGAGLLKPAGWQIVVGGRVGWQLGPLRPYASVELTPTWTPDGEGSSQAVTWTRVGAGASWRRSHRSGFWSLGASLDMWRASPDDGGGALFGAHLWGAVGRHPLDPVAEGEDEVAWQTLLPPPDESAVFVSDGVYRCERPTLGYLVFYSEEEVAWVPGDMGPEAFFSWLDRRAEDVAAKTERVTHDRDIRRFYIDQAWWMTRPVDGPGLAVVRVRGADPRTSTCALVSRPQKDPDPE